MHQNARRCTGCARMYQNATDCTRMQQHAPECTRIHQDARECTGMHQDAPGCTMMHQNAAESIRMHQNAPECTRMPEDAPECTIIYILPWRPASVLLASPLEELPLYSSQVANRHFLVFFLCFQGSGARWPSELILELRGGHFESPGCSK